MSVGPTDPLDDRRTQPAGSGTGPIEDTANPTGSFPTLPAGITEGHRVLPLDLTDMVLADRYRVLELIGSGGMGTVYRAEHITIQKIVAVKVLNDSFAFKRSAIKRFLREARTASKIHHDNVVEVTDFGFSDDRIPFLVMEFLDGEELADLLEREGPLPWARAKGILLQMLAALEAAHEQGIVHRDVKPQNCFVVRHKRRVDDIKVLDFGLAKVITGDTDFRSMSRTGAVLGTAHYMSPEQAESLKVDARTDVYSVGVVAFEMLTGSLPYEAAGVMGVLAKVLTHEVPTMDTVAPDVPVDPRVAKLIRKAMAKDPDERYASAAEFAEAILALPEDIDKVVMPRRFHVGKIAGGVAALGLLAGGAYMLQQWSAHQPEPSEAPTIAVAPADATEDAAVESEDPEPEATPVEDLAPAVEDLPSEEAKTKSERPPKLSTKRVRRAYKRTVKAAISQCGVKAGLTTGTKLQIKFALDRESGGVTSVKLLGSTDAKLAACIEEVVRSKMNVGPHRGGKPDYTVTHSF